MTRYFYAIDYGVGSEDRDPAETTLVAFTVKDARDGFVKDGEKRATVLKRDADEYCRNNFGMTAAYAVSCDLIGSGNIDFRVVSKIDGQVIEEGSGDNAAYLAFKAEYDSDANAVIEDRPHQSS